MEGDAHVEAEHEEVEVVTQTDTRAEGYVLQRGSCKLRTRALRVVAHEPNVAGIEEDGAVEVAEEFGTQFGVCFEFYVARLVHVGVARVGSAVRTRTDGANGEGTYTVGTAHVELVGVRHTRRVAVGIRHTAEETCGDVHVLRQAKHLMHFCRHLHELRKGIAEEVLVALAETLSGSGVAGRGEVARLLCRHLHPKRIGSARGRLISERIGKRGHELVTHGHVERGVGRHDGVERCRGVVEFVELQIEEIEFVLESFLFVPVVRHTQSHAHHVVKLGTVLPVGIEGKLRGRGETLLAVTDAGKHKARIFQSQLRTYLVGVEQRVATV